MSRASLTALLAAMSLLAAGIAPAQQSEPRIILVAGATGTQGGAVARERWYMENTDPVDVDALRVRYDWLMSMEAYLRESGWGTPSP